MDKNIRNMLIELFLKTIAIICLAIIAAGVDRLILLNTSTQLSTSIIYTIYGILVATIIDYRG